MITDFYGKKLEVGDSVALMKTVSSGLLITGKIVNVVPVKAYIGHYYLIDIEVESMKCNKLVRVRADNVTKYDLERTKFV